jgi:hypothetical protein
VDIATRFAWPPLWPGNRNGVAAANVTSNGQRNLLEANLALPVAAGIVVVI